MTRVDPFRLPRAERREERVEHHDPKTDLTFSWVITEPNASQVSRAVEIAGEMVRDFVTGDSELGRPPVPFPDPDVVPTRGFFIMCALASQVALAPPEEASVPWQPIHWAVFSARMPDGWRKVQTAINRLLAGYPERLGEPVGVPMESGCEAPSDSTTSTLRSPSDGTLSSGASTSD